MSIAAAAVASIRNPNQRSKPMSDTAAIPNGRTPEQWAEIIRGKWQDNVKSIFETALYIETAYYELGPALWLKMVRDELKWSKQTGYRLLDIARDDKINEVTPGLLPACWTILHSLTKLTPEQFALGLESGIINPGMQRKDIAELKPKKEKPAPPPEPELKGADLVKRRTFEARQVIVSSMRDMSPEEQADFIALIRLQLEDIETRKKAA
jgi:hypothetical protein